MTKINIPPARDEQALAEVIRQIPALPQGNGSWAITALPSFTNRIFRIARGGEAFTLRLPGRGTERYIDRAAEAANARAAYAIGLGAEIIFAEPASGIMVTRFIEGAVALSPAALKDSGSLEATVGLLRRLHDSGLTFKGVMRLYPKMDEYLKLAPAPELLPLRRAVEPLRPILEAGWGPPRPCHIDPAPHNFIVAEGRRYLLDWEYSAMCEPLWDLAGLSIEGEFDTEQDTTMLTRYLGAAEPHWLSRLYLYRLVLRLLAASWWAVQHADGSGPSGAGATVSRLESSIAAELGDPALVRHVKAASSPAT